MIYSGSEFNDTVLGKRNGQWKSENCDKNGKMDFIMQLIMEDPDFWNQFADLPQSPKKRETRVFSTDLYGCPPVRCKASARNKQQRRILRSLR